MKKEIGRLIISSLLLLGYFGCASSPVQISDRIQEPSVQAVLLREAGYNVTFWILQSNSSYIEKFETGLRSAEDILEAKNLAAAIEAISMLLDDLEIVEPKYAPLVHSAARMLSLFLEVDPEILDEYKQARDLVKIFIQGLLEGIGDAKVVAQIN
jgi:hypothetical protein